MIQKAMRIVSRLIIGMMAFAVVSVSDTYALKTLEEGCLDCHHAGSTVVPGTRQFQNGTSWHTLHKSNSCSSCHPGSAGSKPIQVSSCVTCHATPSCSWQDFHETNVGKTCYGCHSECSSPPPCVPQAENCNDGADNDCDGLADCADPDCSQDAVCSPTPSDDYSTYCASCHGIDGSGGDTAGDIRGRSARQISRAIRKVGVMKYLRFLSRAQIRAIADFLSAN